MTAVRRGVFLAVGERYVLIVIGLASSFILARLLTPEEIGIYSVSLAVIGIAQVMRDFGVSSFLIQERHLSESHVRTAFGFALLLGSCLFLIVFTAAPFAGEFYESERLVETMRVGAVNFLVLPFSSISVSLLRRGMFFKRLAAVNVAAALVGFVTGVSLAYFGAGPMSMALAAVSANLVTGMLAWCARDDRRLLLPSLSEWRDILKFGAQSSATGIVTSVAVDINDLALGRILGFAPVAMMSRAQGLMNLFHRDIMGAVRGVMFPAFAKAHRSGESVDRQYINSVTTITAFAWPFYGFTALYARELIRLMFGPQWDAAVALVPIFCLAGSAAATVSLASHALVAVGRIDLITRAELLIQPCRAVIVVSAALLFESLFACAVAILIVFFVSAPFLYWVKDKGLPTDYKALMAGLWASAKVTVITLVPPAALAANLSSQTGVAEISISVGCAAVLALISWLGGLVLMDHPLKADPLVRSAINRFAG